MSGEKELIQMTVKEVINLKNEAEQEIESIIRSFETRTRMRVTVKAVEDYQEGQYGSRINLSLGL